MGNMNRSSHSNPMQSKQRPAYSILYFHAIVNTHFFFWPYDYQSNDVGDKSEYGNFCLLVIVEQTYKILVTTKSRDGTRYLLGFSQENPIRAVLFYIML